MPASCVAPGVTENRIGSVSPALSQMELRLGRLRAPARGQLQLDRPLGRGLRMDRHADRQSAAVERQNARLGLHAHADGRRHHQRLIDAAGPGNALQRLHHLAKADGQAVEGELRPRRQRIRRKRAHAPLRP